MEREAAPRAPKRIIFSLGYDTSGVISVLTELPLRPGDEIVFLTPSRETPKSREAKESITNFMKLLAQRGLEIRHSFHSLNEEDGPGMVAEIVSLIDSAPGRVYLEALGGLRSIVSAMTIAAILRRGKVAELSAVAESTSRRVRMPLPPLRPPTLTRLDLDILRLTLSSSNGIMTLPYLAETLGRPKTTVSDRLRRLEEWGLLVRIKKKPATYRATGLARIFAGQDSRE